MNFPKSAADKSAGIQAAQLLDRLRTADVRRAGDERRYTKALKRLHADHLSADEAIQLAKNMDVILDKRKVRIGRRLGVLCEKAFSATSSRELYRLRLAEDEDPVKKQLRRSFGKYRVLAQTVAAMTGEPQTKVLRELVERTRFDNLQARMAAWDRIDAVAALLQDLVDRLNDEFRWDELYQRTAEVRLATGGRLTWPLAEHHELSAYEIATGETEFFERRLRASFDPARLYYSDQRDHSFDGVTAQYIDNDQLQSNEFFFVPHAKVGYINVWDLPKRADDPVNYQIERRKCVSSARKDTNTLREPNIGWDSDRREPRGQLDGSSAPAPQYYTWLIAYPSPLSSQVVVPALYTAGEESGAWLMPLDRHTLAAIEDAVWLDLHGESDLVERLETLLGADQTDGICPLESDLRQTGPWLAQNPVLTWGSRQHARRENMLNRARSDPVQR
jgi:hypothetical protein